MKIAPHMGLSFRLAVETKQEDGWVVAYVPALDVSSQGRTRDQAIAAVKEAAAAFLEFCIEYKTIERVLEELGFGDARPTVVGFGDEETIEVPIELIANAKTSPRTLANAC